jgi:GH25 family lysozyme M1 (1,4-beta-N-acetylmuramidase)
MKSRWFPSREAFLLLSFGLLPSVEHAFAQRPLGTDVSSHQPGINWTTVKNAGVTFAWAKATEGTGYSNPELTNQVTGATNNGIYVGAYHYALPSSHPNITGANSADSEAAFFWSIAGKYIKNGGDYLMPMLDWEDTGATLAAGFTSTTMSTWVNEWCNAVSNYAWAAGIVIKPVVYTGAWYSRPGATYPGLTTAVTGWPSWISGYPSCDANNHCGTANPQVGGPSDSYPWSSFNIWQYGNTNWSGGDADVFNGNLAEFTQMFVIGGTNAPFITGNLTNVSVALGGSTTLSVRARGQAPLSFKWFFNGAVISGATSSNYSLANIQLANAGGYSVQVSNSYAVIMSSTAFLSVIAPLSNAPGSIVAPPGLVNWWPADANANDIFSANNATPQGGFTYAPGKQGRAFHFDGATSYLTTGRPSIAAPWTACMWVNRQNAPGAAAALLGDGTYAVKLEQYNLTRQVGFTQFGVGDYTFGYVAPANVWTHLAFVGTSTNTSLYVNGVLQSTLTNTLPLPRGYIGVAYLSSTPKFVDFMLGSLDELLLFNRALTPAQINAIHAAGAAGLVRAPEFTATAPLGNGRFQVNLRGQTGKNFTLYTSPDLVTWTCLGPLANPNGDVQFIDNSATDPVRFYRATQP